MLQFGNHLDDRIKVRRLAENHGAHSAIVLAQGVHHPSFRKQCKSRGLCGGQIEVRAIEEHAGMGDAVFSKRAVCHGRLADLRLDQAEQVVIVARNALTVAPQLPSDFEPPPELDFVRF